MLWRDSKDSCASDQNTLIQSNDELKQQNDVDTGANSGVRKRKEKLPEYTRDQVFLITLNLTLSLLIE